MSHQISLPASLNSEACNSLLNDFLTNKDKDFIVDASSVERAGTPAMQLIISAVKTINNNGKILIIEKSSDEFIKILNDLGCFKFLQEKGVLS